MVFTFSTAAVVMKMWMEYEIVKKIVDGDKSHMLHCFKW